MADSCCMMCIVHLSNLQLEVHSAILSISCRRPAVILCCLVPHLIVCHLKRLQNSSDVSVGSKAFSAAVQYIMASTIELLVTRQGSGYVPLVWGLGAFMVRCHRRRLN